MGPSAAVVNEQDMNDQPPLVDFDGPDDPNFPHNWSILKKVWVTSVLALFNLIGTVTSSIFGPGQKEIMAELGVSQEVAVLGTTLFLVVCYV
jgi:hypothetical protein